jgi:MFS transporter, SIT family, siderophore-iron:H+ symporter
MNHVGSALGNCISGAIWTQTLYQWFVAQMEPFNIATLADAVYDSPLETVLEYPIGISERYATIYGCSYIQRFLTISGIRVSVPMLFFALLPRNPKLSDEVSQPDAEEKDLSQPDKEENYQMDWASNRKSNHNRYPFDYIYYIISVAPS